ncbi:hypothetical protein Sjap_011771 [Stephania japonica]|uniref:(S)-coclaurine-N-methyltransferase n=1 Tax=Stephania japonica TaxID=461633 RepID=A0AAP0JC80_9MAGN
MAAVVGEERRDLVEQKKDKKEEVAELLKRLELGQVPDDEIRRLIRLQLDKRIRWGYKPTYEQQLDNVLNFAQSLRKMKIATAMDSLDSEMYELPISFSKLMFGSTICKSSCCYFKDDSVTLEEAAIAMMDLYCERSQIKDGHRVLDLGCGQGALTMHIARKYKNCHVTGLTNSVAQKELIEEQCKINNLTNVEIMLVDITEHEMEDRYDRILAIAFIEHMKNYELLLRKISKWMTPDGLLFIEHVCQKTFPYHYEPIDEDDWYTEYVFPAGTMIIPSANLLLYFQDDVTVMNHWLVNGKHYSRTHEMWLKNLYDNAKAIKEIMVSFTGSEEAAAKQMNYWRGFALSGMELFGYGSGEEWMASHVLFKNK